MPWSRTPRRPGSRAGCRTRARAAGRWPRRWRRACPPTCSPPPCTSGSPPAGRPTSPTSCCRPCARSSAATRSSPPVSEPGVRMGAADGEPAVTLAAGELEATFLPGLGLLGTSLRHRGEELLALPGGVEGYRDGHVTGLPLPAPWANRLPGWRYRAAGVEVSLEGLDLHTDPAGLAAGAAGRRGRPGGAGGRLRLRRPARAPGRVPLPPPADRDRHPPGVVTGRDGHPGRHRRPAGPGRLRLAPLPPPPRGPEGDLAAPAPPPQPPGAGRPRPAHRQGGRPAG